MSDTENTLHMELPTGRVVIQLRPDLAPQHVARVKQLCAEVFYDNTPFHRVIEGFMAQGGDPTGTGTGGSKLPDLKAEFTRAAKFVRGTVGAARTAHPDSANSQFYIMFQPMLKLDNHYTVFGRVVQGMPYVDAIQRGEPPANPTRIVRAIIASDPAANTPPPPLPPVAAPAALPSGPVTPPDSATPPPSGAPQQ